MAVTALVSYSLGRQDELKGRSDKIVLAAFDLLCLDGHDLRQLPLFERKAHLKKLVDRTPSA
jgi:bifunctional non-homologous end joining protein LigD